MAIREVRIYGDEVLEKNCKEVKKMTPRLQEFVDDMFETMYDAGGVGLAAPQVGLLKRIVVIDTTGEDPYVFINPKITAANGEQTGYEGCLSIPGKSAIVTRPESVTVEALDREMNPFTLEANDLLARAICHEVDHLDGIMYVERMEGELIDNEELMAAGEEAG